MSENKEINDDRFLVSGWEDDLNDIDEEENPHENAYKEVLWAAEQGDFDKLKELVDNNVELIKATDKDGYTPLHRACYGNKIEIVEYLLSKGANVSSRTQMGWEPLHSCCQWNNTACAVRLIQAGADVNSKSDGGQTPLHVAASYGAQYDNVQLLLTHPYIKTDIKNNQGETAYQLGMRGSKYYRMFEMAEPCLQGIPDM